LSDTALVRAESGAVVRHSDEITDVQRIGNILAASGYFTDAREMAQAAVKVMAGKELGIPPVAAMMGINIIKGKVALGGNLIASRVRAHGYEYRHKQFDSKGCILTFWSKPNAQGTRELLGESSFTEDDAKAAGVFTDMYKKYPRNMYFNRAISNGAKWYCPEVTCGMPVYTPEELGATVDQDGEMVHPEPTQAQVREQKLEQARAIGIDSKPAPTASVDMKAMLVSFKELKDKFEAMGEIGAYYQILGNHGYEHANEIRPLAKAREIYREMLTAYRELDLQVHAGDEPESSDLGGDGHEQ
jgi:hypothetical protein